MNPESQSNHFPTRIGLMLGLSVFAIICGGEVQRVNPGGPFFSVGGDVLPTLAAVVVLLTGITVFRTGHLLAIAVSCILMLVACYAITNVVTGVLQFWNHPSARGALFGS